jgi:hypothetical protein
LLEKGGKQLEEEVKTKEIRREMIGRKE